MESIGRFLRMPEQSFFLLGPRGTGKSTWLRAELPGALFVDLLKPEVYRVLSAGSAEAAYTLLESQEPSALLLDIQLPTMSGLALYLAIVHRWPHLDGRIAIMTGDADAEDVRGWLEQNRCTVLRKPFDLREISAWLDHGAGSRRQELGNG